LKKLWGNGDRLLQKAEEFAMTRLWITGRDACATVLDENRRKGERGFIRSDLASEEVMVHARSDLFREKDSQKPAPTAE